MARRGGLGRGLDSLIPNRNAGKREEEREKPAKGNSAEKTDKKISEDEPDKIKQESEESRNDEKTEKVKKSEINLSEESEKTSKKKQETSKKAGELKEKIIKENNFGEDATPDQVKSDAGEESVLTAEEAGMNENINPPKVKADIATEYDKKTAGSQSPKINESGDVVINMRISRVEPNRKQPRKYFDDDAISELADSIKQFGIIQPLLVQKRDGYYEIIAGERRWRAAKLAGLKEVPVIVRNFSNQEAVEISLIENLQREDLNPIEEAKAYERLVNEFGLSQEAVAARVSKSRSAVANAMRLLRLDESIQKMVEEGSLSEGHARTLLAISDPKKQKEAAERIINESLSVRQTEKLVKELTSKRAAVQKERDERREAILQSLMESLKTSLKTKVTIKDSGRHKGKIEIEYYSDEDLERLTDILRNYEKGE